MTVGGSSGLGAAIVFGVLFIVRIAIRHAGSDGSELLEPMEDMLAYQTAVVEATEEITQQLAQVQDADSAQAVSADLQAAFERSDQKREEVDVDYSDVSLRSILNISEATQEKMDEITDQMIKVEERSKVALEKMADEIERIMAVSELPVEFWDTHRGDMASYAALAYEDQEMYADEGEFSDGPNPMVFDKLATKIEEHGSQSVVFINFVDIDQRDFNKADRELREAAGQGVNVNRWYLQDKEQGYLIFSPTDKFQELVDRLPTGEFTIQDEVQRTLVLKFKELPPQDQPQQAPAEQTAVAAVAEQTAPPTPQFQPATNPSTPDGTGHVEIPQTKVVIPAEPQVEVPKPPADQQQPDENQQQYYQRLAGLMLEKEPRGLSQKAIDHLLEIEPDQILEKNTRGQVAKNFRQLALNENNRQSQAKAIQGLVKYGGKYCVPILLDMLAKDQVAAKAEFYQALSEYPHKKTAEALVQRLEKSQRDEPYLECLQAMGTHAELPLIRLARGSDKALTLTIVELLGDVGTQKSFALIRKHSKGKDEKLSEAANASTMKIRKRLLATKESKSRS